MRGSLRNLQIIDREFRDSRSKRNNKHERFFSIKAYQNHKSFLNSLLKNSEFDEGTAKVDYMKIELEDVVNSFQQKYSSKSVIAWTQAFLHFNTLSSFTAGFLHYYESPTFSSGDQIFVCM